MGVQGSVPEHAAQVRLELPEARCPPGSYFFARLHTAANGHVKYKAWGQPQNLGLFPDDIIMVSIHSAKSEAHFELDNCEDIGELYIPWEEVQKKIISGEGVFRLGTSTGSKSLGLNATKSEYQESFACAQMLAKDSKAIAVLIHIRKLEDSELEALVSCASPRAQASGTVLRTTPQSSPRLASASPLTSQAPLAALSKAQASHVSPIGQSQQSLTSPVRRLSSGAPVLGQAAADPTKTLVRAPYRSLSPESLNPATSQSRVSTSGKQPTNMRLVSAPAIRQAETMPGQSSSLIQASTPPQSAVVRTVGSSVEVPRALIVPRTQQNLNIATPPRQVPGSVPPFRSLEEKRASLSNPSLAGAQRQSASVGSLPSGSEELGNDDMRMLRQIQVQNQRLRNQLGLREDEELPEVDEKIRVHIKRLQEDVYKNFALLEKLQKADKEMALISASLSKDERLDLIEVGGSLAAPVSASGMMVEDEADVRRRTEGMMTEIQQVTQANIKLIKEYDEAIKVLEKDLSAARRQHQQIQQQGPAPTSTQLRNGDDGQLLQSCKQELQALKSECQSLQDTISQESERKREADLRTIQKLETEKEVLLEEISILRRSLNDDNEEDEDVAMTIPATGVLTAEADKLQSQLQEEKQKGQQEEENVALQIEDLRKQTKGFEMELEHVHEEKQRVQNELQELRLNRDGAKAIERDRLELEQSKTSIAHAALRSKSMIQVYDEKIEALLQETNDIRLRVGGIPSTSGD